jgi:hypothetical protein
VGLDRLADLHPVETLAVVLDRSTVAKGGASFISPQSLTQSKVTL